MSTYKDLKKYCYIVHPDIVPTYEKDMKPYPRDIDSIVYNMDRGVIMYRNPDLYGFYTDDENIDYNNFEILRYFQERYRSSREVNEVMISDYPEDDVPIFVLKYPALYDGVVETDDPNLIPYPTMQFKTAIAYQNFKTYEPNEKSKNTFENNFRMAPGLVYGVYSRDLGGFIKYKDWNPLFDAKGYVFNKRAFKKLKEVNEMGMVDVHHKLNMNSERIKQYEEEHGSIYMNHDTKKVMDRYASLFKDDIDKQHVDGEKFNELDIYNALVANWDPTKGLTPLPKDQRSITRESF